MTKLTRTQRAVLRLIAEGAETPEIARELGMAPATVKTHVQGVMDRLDVHTRAAAVAVGMRTGELDAEPYIELRDAWGYI